MGGFFVGAVGRSLSLLSLCHRATSCKPHSLNNRTLPNRKKSPQMAAWLLLQRRVTQVPRGYWIQCCAQQSRFVMVTIVGFIVVTGCVLGGFTWAGGHVGHLIHPSEILTIGGAALGAAIVMSPMKVLKDLMKGLLACFKSNPFNKVMYEDMFKLMYELFKVARRNGLLALEPHLSNPHESQVFHHYPKISHNHHVCDFIVGSLTPILEGSVKPEALGPILEAEIKAMEDEHHAPIDVLSKTADGLPGFGIVAAVLGIVITMAHINGPVEEIGHKVGAALVGTFLGILMSYGFIAPLVVKMHFNGVSEAAFFRTIAAVVEGFVAGLPPKIAIEQARRGLNSEVRMTREQLEEIFTTLDKS